jgi:hypothetical protein
MRRYGIALDQLSPTRPQNPVTAPRMTMPDEELNRAIALLDEQSIESFRRKIAKKRAKNAAKPARRKK